MIFLLYEFENKMALPFMLVLSLASVSQILGQLECAADTNSAGPGSAYVLVPVSPSDSGHLLMTASAEEARNTAVCHTLCVNYIFEGASAPNGSNGTATNDSTNSAAPDLVPPREVCDKQFRFALQS